MNQKGFSAIIIVFGLVLIIGTVSTIYYLAGAKDFPVKQQAQKNAPPVNTQHLVSTTPDPLSDDELIKDSVNSMQAKLKQFYAEKGVYPKNLAELKEIMNLQDSFIKDHSNPPYLYTTSDDQNYSFSAVLSNGERFQGDETGINRYLDAKVKSDVSLLLMSVNVFYNEKQRLPKNIDETLEFAKDFSGSTTNIKQPIDPYSRKPYLYTIHDDKRNFTISGTLSNDKEYADGSSF